MVSTTAATAGVGTALQLSTAQETLSAKLWLRHRPADLLSDSQLAPAFPSAELDAVLKACCVLLFDPRRHCLPLPTQALVYGYRHKPRLVASYPITHVVSLRPGFPHRRCTGHVALCRRTVKLPWWHGTYNKTLHGYSRDSWQQHSHGRYSGKIKEQKIGWLLH